MSKYAARIRAARGYADMTQQDLADALGVDVQTIKRRESGGQDPKRGELIAIAAICGVPREFMDEGFGVLERNELAQQLDRIEETLSTGKALLRDFLRYEPPPGEKPADKVIGTRMADLVAELQRRDANVDTSEQTGATGG